MTKSELKDFVSKELGAKVVGFNEKHNHIKFFIGRNFFVTTWIKNLIVLEIQGAKIEFNPKHPKFFDLYKEYVTQINQGLKKMHNDRVRSVVP